MSRQEPAGHPMQEQDRRDTSTSPDAQSRQTANDAPRKDQNSGRAGRSKPAASLKRDGR